MDLYWSQIFVYFPCNAIMEQSTVRMHFFFFYLARNTSNLLFHTKPGPILISNVVYKLWIYIGPKILYIFVQCEHNTNATTDALRNWDQYKSQMYYINCGFILVPKFCIFSMQCDHGTNYSSEAFFFASRNKYTKILSWHALGPI